MALDICRRHFWWCSGWKKCKLNTQNLFLCVPEGSLCNCAWQCSCSSWLPGTVAEAAFRDTETMWCAAHSWNVAMDGHTVFRKVEKRWGCHVLHTELLDKCSAPVSNWRRTCWELLGQDHSKEQPGGGCSRWVVQTADYEEAGAEASNLEPLSSLGISATWLSAGRAAQHWAGNPGRSSSAVVTFPVTRVGSHNWLVHAGLAFCWGAGKKWGWEGSQSSAQAVAALSEAAAVMRWQMQQSQEGEPQGSGWADWLTQEIACGKQLWRGKVSRRANWFLERAYWELMHELYHRAGAQEASADSPWARQGHPGELQYRQGICRKQKRKALLRYWRLKLGRLKPSWN